MKWRWQPAAGIANEKAKDMEGGRPKMANRLAEQERASSGADQVA